MKKFAITALSVLCVLLMGIMMAACTTSSDPDFVGTYKFQSWTITETRDNGETFTDMVTPGMDINGGHVTEDFLVLEVKDDGTFTTTFTLGLGGNSHSGTWTSDGNKIDLEADGGVLSATLEGDILTILSESQSWNNGDLVGVNSSVIKLKKQ